MELLSPSGNYNSSIKAFNAGADAIYIGGKKFSARMSADNFSNEEIIEIINYAHILNKKVYVTMNTLIYQDEFMEAVKYAEFLHKNNVDALIIQDVGFAFYLHKVYPNLVLHASTQINCHSIEQAKALKEVGFTRVVLARETTLEFAKEVKNIGLEVEVFVHGALCVSYSGNCLMSSFIGSRSGNRGRCAQPCRMKYTLCTDNNEIITNYSLSTKDLNTLSKVSEYYKYDIDSLKIEGRLKQNEYVFLVTKAYRNALNNYKNKLEEDESNLKSIFSREFTKGYIFNESPFNLLNQKSSSHQGEVIGKVTKINFKSVFILLSKDIHRLDGIRFNDDNQIGFQIQKMFINNRSVDEAKNGQIIEIKNIDFKVKLGVEIIRTSSYKLLKNAELESNKIVKYEISGRIIAFKNKPLAFEIITDNGRIKKSGEIVKESINNGTSKERIIEQFSKLGNYPLLLKKIDFKGNEDIFIPISSINKLKNEVINEYIKLISLKKEIIINKYECNVKNKTIDYISLKAINYYDYQDLLCKENKIESFFIKNNNLTERINFLTNNNDKMVHNFVKGENLIASCYCNITNSYSLDAFYSFGFKECILSIELDYQSILMIIDDYYSRHNAYPNIGLMIYGRNDMMISKSCPIGTIFNNKNIKCDRCKKQQFYLKDRMNAKFPLICDSNCNTRVLDYRKLYLIDIINELNKRNIYNFYLNFTLESKEETKEIILNAKRNLLITTTLKNSDFYQGHYNKRAL